MKKNLLLTVIVMMFLASMGLSARENLQIAHVMPSGTLIYDIPEGVLKGYFISTVSTATPVEISSLSIQNLKIMRQDGLGTV